MDAPSANVHKPVSHRLCLFMALLAIAVLGAAGFLIYTFVLEPAMNSQSTSRVAGDRNSTTRAPGPPTTRTPTVSRAPTPPTPEVYGIELVYAPSPTPLPTTIVNAFESAKAKWQSILVEPGVSPRPPVASDLCGHPERTYNGIERIDDLEIWVEIGPIDGPGQILGYAGPCGIIVSGTWRSVTGEMVFDVDDLEELVRDGSLTDVIAHEMGHVLGLGSFWDTRFANLVNPPSPNYLGSRGQSGYTSLGGSGAPPVETDGGTGTAFSHWDDARFGSELMTGFISSGRNPLSLLTVRALEDLGYIVNPASAESYTLPQSGRRLRGGMQTTQDDERNASHPMRQRRRMMGDQASQHRRKTFPLVFVDPDDD